MTEPRRLDDDQLATELRRRSHMVSLSHGWARHDLLPGVSSAIDSRPQRVATSRGPAFAGLVAAVAILLVLVVAMPRIEPDAGPSAASTPGTASRALSAVEFANRFSTGELNESTVLVDGRIRPYDSDAILYGTVCGHEQEILHPLFPTHDCTMGRLDGVEQSVWVNAPYVETKRAEMPSSSETPVWSWRSAVPPIEGQLVLSISGVGVITYTGTVLSSSSEPISVGEANQVAIDSLAAEDVLLVEGWLWSPEASGRQFSIDCIGPRFSPLPGLPNNYCQIQDSLVSEQPPAGELMDLPGARLAVQRGAARAYGARTDNEAHVFALAPRLYGGGCEGEPPCWQWQVVARISDADLGPTPSALPSAREIGCERAESVTPSGRADIVDETGLVQRCETTHVEYPDAQALTVSNLVGDQSILEISWAGIGCDDFTTFTLRRAAIGYELVAVNPTPINLLCDARDGVVFRTQVLLYLTAPISAETVTTSIVRGVQESPRPTPTDPAPTPNVALEPIACSLDSVHATVYDQTGLVESCTTVEPTDNGGTTTASNPGGDLRQLHINWGSLRCDADARFRLKASPVGYTLEQEPGTSFRLDDGTPVCVLVPRRFAIRLLLRADIDASSVAIVEVPAESPPPTTTEVGPAWWELAPTERPTDASTELDLLVFERECANGESPEGRVGEPEIEYGALSVTITFQIRSAGGGDCPAAPGAPVTVQLSEPLGDRRLVDGGFASSDRVIQHDHELLWVFPLRSFERATARLVALLGPDACQETTTEPRAVDESQLEQLANDLGESEGMLGDGLAWVGSLNSAVPELGGFELYQDRDRAFFMIAFAEQQQWLADDVETGDLVLADITSLPISGGRTIWIVGRYHQSFGSADCTWQSDATSAAGPRADSQAFDFTVAISAPSATWDAGEPINGAAAFLEYAGTEESITVSGSGSGPVFTSWTRLDGGDPVSFGNTDDCQRTSVRRGERTLVPIRTFGAYDNNGTLMLPTGIWRLSATTYFTIGNECGGQPVDVSASIIVRVR